MVLDNYVLVTPCKDEASNIHRLLDSILDQTVRPILWVIVDDGSTDGSSSILDEVSSKYTWIHVLHLSEGPRDLGIHVSHVYISGFEYALRYCRSNSIDLSYIASVDADVMVDPDYYDVLIGKFKENSNLGVCSGHIGNIVENKIIFESFLEDFPSGGARLWSKECFDDTGGYILTCCPDSVSNVKARLRGWDAKSYADVKAISTRPYSSAQGQWIGYKKLGSNNYYVGYHPVHVMLKGIKFLYSRSGYTKHGMGVAYILGYFINYIKRSPRIDDTEIFDYYNKTRLREIIWHTTAQKGKK